MDSKRAERLSILVNSANFFSFAFLFLITIVEANYHNKIGTITAGILTLLSIVLVIVYINDRAQLRGIAGNFRGYRANTTCISINKSKDRVISDFRSAVKTLGLRYYSESCGNAQAVTLPSRRDAGQVIKLSFNPDNKSAGHVIEVTISCGFVRPGLAGKRRNASTIAIIVDMLAAG
jgi:hypothetical protein